MIHEEMDHFKRKNDSMYAYFKDNGEDIDVANLQNLRALSTFCCITILIVALITVSIFPGWRPSVFHSMFLALMCVFAVMSFIIYEHRPLKKGFTGMLCFAFMLSVMVFLCIFDTVLFPESGQIFISIFMVAAPVLFIAPFLEMLLSQILYLSFFVFMTNYFKPIEVAEIDTLGVIIGFLISFAIYSTMMNVRLEEYQQKTNYRLISELDGLTGIANRAFSKHKIESFINIMDEDSTSAMLLLDVDNFKGVNDTLGHSTGDEVLKAVADILTGAFRKSDTIGRFGGDEFIVFLENFHDRNLLECKCQEINEKMSGILDGRFGITCSMGVCILKTKGVAMEKLFRAADEALYEAKTFSKGRYVIREYEEKKLKVKEPVMVIIDDSMIDREVLAIQFEENFEIMKFEDGVTALQYIQANKQKIDIILVDMVMPGINGLDILKSLKRDAETTRIPVIVISSDEMAEEEALFYGAEDMIIKPVVPAVARLRVRNAMHMPEKRNKK